MCSIAAAEHIKTNNKRYLALILICSGLNLAFANCNSGLPRGTAPPAFTLNFTPLDQERGTNGNTPACMSTTSVHNDAEETDDFIHNQTPWLTQNSWYASGNAAVHWQLPQVVTDGTYNYYHMILGDETDGFVQESYIRMGFHMPYDGINQYSPAASPMTWKFATKIASNKHWHSASGGDNTVDVPGQIATVAGNAMYPLTAPEGKDDGNGSANPNMVIMRQLHETGDMSMEFLKSSFDHKPKITMRVDDVYNGTAFTSATTIDMSNISYEIDQGQNHQQQLENMQASYYTTQTISTADATMHFNSNDSVQRANVTAGKYWYAEGSGPGGSEGTYTYLAGEGFDMSGVNWDNYLNLDDPSGNPWVYTENRPTN